MKTCLRAWAKEKTFAYWDYRLPTYFPGSGERDREIGDSMYETRLLLLLHRKPRATRERFRRKTEVCLRLLRHTGLRERKKRQTEEVPIPLQRAVGATGFHRCGGVRIVPVHGS